MRHIGVEEELLLVDEATGFALPVARRLLRGRTTDVAADSHSELTAEMQLEMVEAVSSHQQSLDGLREAIAEGRSAADEAARRVGARAAALATSPLPVRPHPTAKSRYQEMVQRYGVTARESLTCGFHVHVTIDSAEEGVAILDRIRTWLPMLRALSANSPFRGGIDTGYASFRTVAWSQWPSSGPIEVLGSADAYTELERELLDTGVLLDAGMFYFDARLSRNHPTVEIRVADVCLRQEDAVTIAALARGLVETAVAEWKRGVAPTVVSTGAIRLAAWQAALVGVRGDLVDPATGTLAPAATAIGSLVDHVRPALADYGDLDTVESGVGRIIDRGTGADWQRSQSPSIESFAELVKGAIELTRQ